MPSDIYEKLLCPNWTDEPKTVWVRPTEKANAYVRKSWTYFHMDLREKDVNPDQVLEEFDPKDICAFLSWKAREIIEKKGHPPSRSTILTYYKRLQYLVLEVQLEKPGLLTKQEKEYTNKIVQGFITELEVEESVIVPPFGEKEICTLSDLHAVLQFSWCFDAGGLSHERYWIQTALLMQLISYTSSRPGVLVESSGYANTNEYITYKNITDNSGDSLVLVIRTTLLKGGSNTREPVEYLLHPEPDIPLRCPIILLLALASADDAFENKGITLADIFQLKVRDESSSALTIPWKKSILDTPQAATEGVTTAIRQKILSHSSPGVIKHYMQPLVTMDTQSLFLGKQSRAELMEASIRMGRVRDPRPPVKLSSEENKVTESDHPQLSILDAEREEVKRIILVLYRTITNAKGTLLGKHHQKLSVKINNLRQKVRATRLTQVEALHQKISTAIPDFKLAPHTRIARYFLGYTEFDIPQVIADMVELCRDRVMVPSQHIEDSILDDPMAKPQGRPPSYTLSDSVTTPHPTASDAHASRSAG
ncbi:hypothetical protein HOY82DRAFT_605824 [Tuber indicum]|nr:hypothetical protein HOY82DRAFT_605824 [Tuber indicum]